MTNRCSLQSGHSHASFRYCYHLFFAAFSLSELLFARALILFFHNSFDAQREKKNSCRKYASHSERLPKKMHANLGFSF